MEYRRLGNSGLEVSPLCLGAMMFGDRTDAASAKGIVDAAFDAGVNFIDTADNYTKGASERVVGQAIKSNRARWIVATKVANVMTEKPHDGGLSRRWIMRACDDSLTRLGDRTRRIDPAGAGTGRRRKDTPRRRRARLSRRRNLSPDL